MKLSLKGFTQLVEDMSAALQSSASSLVDVSVGSVIRAIFEANASVVLWMQWLVLQVLQMTRATTSTGADLDSWMHDFGLNRLPAVAAAGIVTFSRFAANIAATIPVGTVVKTSDGSLSFVVIQDSSISIWQPALSAYVVPAGVVGTDLPVVCRTSGLVGNVLSGSVNIIASSLPCVDKVVNQNPMSSGVDAESDEAFRSRFQGFLATRSRATVAAVSNAIACVRQGLDILIKENTGLDGLYKVGAFLVVVDDGSGHPSPALLSNVTAAIETVRPIGTTFGVVSPTVLLVNVKLTVDFGSIEVRSDSIDSIRRQIVSYLNSLSIGRMASITRVAQRAYVAEFNVENVHDIQLNGISADIVPPPLAVIKAGQITVSANGG